MKHRAIFTAAALALVGSAATAQDAVSEPVAAPEAEDSASSTPQVAPKSTIVQDDRVQAVGSGVTTWYALIAVAQVKGPNGCIDHFYKLSTTEPIVFEGPDTLTAYHADEVVAQWMMHLHGHSPSAWAWFNGPEGHQSPQVYFRNSAEEALQAFRADGHLSRNRSCYGETLVKVGPGQFEFEPPVSFAETNFGVLPPAPSDAVVLREVPEIPGAE